MAATKRNRTKPSDPLYEKTRAKIKVSQLVNRLNKNALGTLTNPPGRTLDEDEEQPIVEMTNGQIKSAEILLNKTLPNLQSTEVSGPGGRGLFDKMSSDELDQRIKELEIDKNDK